MPDYSSLTATPRKRKPRGGFGKLLIVLALLGGLGAAGYFYGPEIYEKGQAWVDGEEPQPDEPEAPLAFPRQIAAAVEIRNATFVIDDVDPEESTPRYEITTDFETRASRVLIVRDELPALEVLTFLDQAVVRRVDEEVWYRTARGQFPLGDQLERDRWVRYLDELIPAGNRPYASIEESTTSLVDGEEMRHIVVSVDPSMLTGPPITAGSFVASADDMLDPTAVGAEPATEPVPPAGATDPIAVGEDPAAIDPASPTTVVAGPVPAPAGAPALEEPVHLELWIDDRGLIRQMVTPDVLGGETITVTAVSAEAWLPPFPLEEQVEPLTASALVNLGL